MVESGDLDRVVNLTRVIGAAGDAVTDDIVSRLAETVGELLCIADRLARSESLLRLLDLLDNKQMINTLVEFGEAVTAVDSSHNSNSKGGISGMMKTMSDPDMQDALKYFSSIFREMKKT